MIIVTFTKWLSTWPYRDREGNLREALFTKSTLQFYKIKETCECNVHLLEKHVTYSLLISTHQPQTPGKRQLGFVTLSVAVHQCNLWPVPGLHRVSDVRIMQYCHIGSDASSSHPKESSTEFTKIIWTNRPNCCYSSLNWVAEAVRWGSSIHIFTSQFHKSS